MKRVKQSRERAAFQQVVVVVSEQQHERYVSYTMLRKAIQRVVDDSSFHLPVEPAATALQQAKCVLDWGSKQENARVFEEFEEKLLQELKSSIPSALSDSYSFVTARSDMCCSYHTTRTSPHFITLWSSFISKVTDHSLPQPTFYQEVTDLVFEDLVHSALPVQTDEVSKATAILYEDANVIHYTAGYVCHKTYSKIQQSNQSSKQELSKCVMGLLEK